MAWHLPKKQIKRLKKGVDTPYHRKYSNSAAFRAREAARDAHELAAARAAKLEELRELAAELGFSLTKMCAWVATVRRRVVNATGARNGRQLRAKAGYIIENFPADAVGLLADALGVKVLVEKKSGRVVRVVKSDDPAQIADFARLQERKARPARTRSAPRA